MQFSSLRARLLVPTLTASVVAMAAAAVVGATLVVQYLESVFEQQAERTVEMVAHVGTPYITNYDLTALGTFVRELQRDKQVAFAEFFDAENKSLTGDVTTAVVNTDGLKLIEREMKDSTGKVVGKLKAGFRGDAIVVARNMVLSAIGGGMLAVLVVVAGLLLWSVRHVMKVIGAEPKEAVAVADGIASGDLTLRVAVAGNDNSSLTWSLSRMQRQLQQIVGDIRRASGMIDVSSAEIAQGHADLSTRTEEQASSLEQTAASMEQMTATVAQNAENAKKASQLANAASDTAARGGQAVGTVVATMTGISESSKKIADIIGVIDGIAFQTNILALNAAVEAARAGEQGRGFAVVASEVRSLAQRSAAAAKEIRQLISDSVGRIDAGSKQVEAAGETMGEIVASVRRVTDLIAEISAASQEQSQSLTQVSDTVTQLEKVTQQNAAMVEQATAASDSPVRVAPAEAQPAKPAASALPRQPRPASAGELKAPRRAKDKPDEGWEEF
jgi:methyl-accepting chemotaxis protein